MDGFNAIQKMILKEHSRAIVHMRKRLSDQKFSLVFGAGVSKDFKIPDWDTLIYDIANDREVRGKTILDNNIKRSHSSKSQVLFHHFAAKLCSRKGKILTTGEIKNEWRNIVRKHLYKNKGDVDKKDDCFGHPYLPTFVPIINRTPMTITYNFDDYIEQILQRKSTEKRIYETIWDPQLQTKLTKCVIYHPNGFLPRNQMERQSEGLVFCEDEFADQLIESMAGRYASLLHHYSQNTCLFIGLSLEDATLKHLLRQSAKLNPGHYHYYVVYQDGGPNLSQNEKNVIFEANFNLYNLITLFMDSDKIKELGRLIDLPNDAFVHKAGLDSLNLMYCYYVVGAIGAGKSTTISYFRNLFAHDEWPDFRIPELGKDWETLSDTQKRKVDNWIAEQFRKKNDVLCDAPESLMGMHIIDRAPLDPIAFTKKTERCSKANFLLSKIHENEKGFKIRKGHVILLLSDSDVLEERAKTGGKKYDSNKLTKMQEDLKRIYKSQNGMTMICTKNKKLEQVIKEVGKVIHRKEYKELNLHVRITKIKKGIYKC